MLPEDWVRSTVGDACAIKNNLRLPLSTEERDSMKGPYPYFGPTGVLGNIDHYRLDGEFALVGEDGDHFLKFRDREMTLFFSGKANVNNHAHVIGNSGFCVAKWFYYWFMHRDLTSVLSRQGVARYKLTKASLEELELWLPPPEEQLRVCRLLDVWERSIAASERLFANRRLQKQFLIRRSFLHQHRRQMAHAAWSFHDFDDVFERVIRKNSVGETNVLTISGEHGLISQRDYFNKSVASENLAGYTLLHKGEFAYNKSYSAGYPMGAIKPLQKYPAGVVSSLYLCFRIRDEKAADLDFFRHYFEAGMLNEQLTGIAQEGARNHGLLNVGVGDFFKLRLHVPNIEEQRRIARILNTAEAEERSIALQIEALRKEKQALMQQLLTGKRRVRLADAAVKVQKTTSAKASVKTPAARKASAKTPIAKDKRP